MNANQILPYHEYAAVDRPSRNVIYYPGARRVRVNHVYTVEDEWRQRKQNLVECVLLDSESGEEIENGRVRTLRARQIVAPWSEHLVEKARHEEKRRKQNEEREARLAEQERVMEERRQERIDKDNEIYELLEDAGIPRHIVTLNSYEVRIQRYRLEEVLKESHEQ